MTAGISSSSFSSSSQPPPFASFIFLDDDDDDDVVSRRLAAVEQIKFICSYGGKILPRRPDGKLRYVGGHTRVISVRRSISFSELEKKLRELSRWGGATVSLRCQLPTLDLDALVSVTSDDDLLNLINEYAADRDVPNPLRIRAFLFFPPARSPSPSAATTTTSSPSFTTSPDSSSPSTSPPPPAAPISGATGRELRSCHCAPLVPASRVRRQENPASSLKVFYAAEPRSSCARRRRPHLGRTPPGRPPKSPPLRPWHFEGEQFSRASLKTQEEEEDEEELMCVK